MLDMRQVTKVYRTELVETHALRSLDLHVAEGEFVAVTGPSGSGKTTFLNIAGLLETFTEGDYLLDGENVRGMSDDARSRLRNHKIGFIFQGFNLIPDLNLFDNVDVPLRYRGMPAAERKQRIEDALARVVAQVADVLAVEQELPAGEGLQQAGDVEEGGLARTRRTGDGDELALADMQVEGTQRMRFHLFGAVDLGDLAHL